MDVVTVGVAEPETTTAAIAMATSAAMLATAAKAVIAERVTLLVTALTKATAAKRVYQFSFLRTHGVAQNLERLNIVSILT